MQSISQVLIEYREEPLGLDVIKPRFSWQMVSDSQNVIQTAYRVIVKSENELFWDSEKIQSSTSVHIEYEGKSFKKCTKYDVQVYVWDNKGKESIFTTYFETGLLFYENFKAAWITHTLRKSEEACPVFKKNFAINKEISSARIYSTVLGIYDLYINGKRVSNEYFSPGWTSYNKRLQYQTYDVIEYLKESNELQITVANGWYKGNLAYEKRINIYGDRAAVLLELHLKYTDGSWEIIVTDDSWLCSTGEVRYSEIYHGEIVDKTYKEQNWLSVKNYDYKKNIIISQECEPVRIIKKLNAEKLLRTPEGDIVIDFGQNLTGFVEFDGIYTKGKEIFLQHAEVLDKYGNFYIENMREAKTTDKFICSGENEVYSPRFTFHGFRYVKIRGLGTSIDIKKFRACVLHTDMKKTGDFKCSDEMVNQLQHNIQWGQRGNFLDVPTDCPQRDERLGWTGDAQVFAGTAAYNFNVALFFGKWLKDLAADQGDNGAVPFVIPDALIKNTGLVKNSAAWGDAAVIVPWTVYETYGDKKILLQQYSSMKAWVDYIANEAGKNYLWKTGFHFGDWLGLDMEQIFAEKKGVSGRSTGATDKYYIASAFFAYSTEILIRTAKVLEIKEDVDKYTELHKNIVEAFRDEYITANGRLVCETQTGILLAVKFNLIEDKHRKSVMARLADNLKRHDMHMVTGFVGTPYLCTILSENGYHDLAGKLLLQTEYPSWLYPITKGATTIWERWNGIKPNGDFETPEMNSFNHYAYGAIGEWMYKNLLGINSILPGYKKIAIEPKPIEGINWAEGSIETLYGLVSVKWMRMEEKIKVDIVIPVNCTALVKIRDSAEIIEVGSGEYTFYM